MAKFVYYNNNPNGLRTEDCVTRAITLASGLPYYTIQEKLYYTSKLLDCDKLCICCYKFLLDDVFKYKRMNCDNLLVDEFVDMHPYGVYLLRINGHITCAIDDTVYDIWDCRDELVTDAWRVE